MPVDYIEALDVPAFQQSNEYAPNTNIPLVVRGSPTPSPRPWIFLAGGITDCEDWQQIVREDLQGREGLNATLINPRRKDFPIHDPNASQEQIAWEKHQLDQADVVSYWFDDGTVQPIVLLELGRFMDTDKPIVVGADPRYARRQDVEIQLGLARPGLPIADSLEGHIENIIMVIQAYHLLGGRL